MVRVLVILAFLAAWFLPLIIAALYKLPHQGPIAVLSLALGWTGVGWLAALVITIGGAIRATRPALAAWGPSPAATAQFPAGAEQPTGQYPAGAPYPGAQPPEQAQGQERAQAPERPPSRWPDSPR